LFNSKADAVHLSYYCHRCHPLQGKNNCNQYCNQLLQPILVMTVRQ